MNNAVFCQVLPLLEPLVTGWALKWFLPCVDATVSLELGRILEAPLAV